MSTKNIQRNYLFTPEMAVALRKLCDNESMNEAAFVRLAVASKLEDYGIVVNPVLKHGGRRGKAKSEPKKRGLVDAVLNRNSN